MPRAQFTIENVSNQENMHARVAAKTVITSKAAVPKRAALGDVELSEANKLSNVNNNNAVPKKPGAMGPPHAIPKKPVANVTKKESVSHVSKKDNVTNLHESHPNITRPVLKKQDSSLKNITRDADRLTGTLKSYSSKRIYDPDENTKNEPQMVTEYIGDIFSYLRELECKFSIRKNYLEDHQSTPKMRATLLNWLVEVHMNFKLYAETLHLCIAIVDRYLQDNKNIGRDTLQLVGISALLVAVKYEEMYLTELEDYVYICDNTFSKRQILQMEMEILKKLDFTLGRPLSLHFLRRYNKIAQVRNEHHNLGKYLLELALLDYDMCHVRPSIEAAAACCLSLGIINKVMDLPKIWTPTLVHYTTYEYSDIRDTILDLARLIVKAETSKYQTVQKKYSTAAYAKISLDCRLQGPLIRKLTSTPLSKK